MAIKLTTTKRVARNVKVLVYGDAGTGKTTLCSTAPSPLIISAESGLLSLRDFDLPVIEVNSVGDVNEVFDFVTKSDEAKHFETVCLDSLSEIAEVLLSQYKKEEKDPRKAYGRLSDDMSTLIRSFRDLPDKHVYFTAKIGKTKDELTGITSYAPSMPGNSLTQALPFFFDEVLCLRFSQPDENGNSYRYLQTQPDFQYNAKDRSGNLKPISKPHLGEMFNSILQNEKPKKDNPEKQHVEATPVAPNEQPMIGE